MQFTTPKTTILCVDDSNDILFLCKSVLERNGYCVHTAASAEEGLGKLAQYEIDAAIVDCEMPGMNGILLAREINRSSANIPVLMFSASQPPENAKAIDVFIPKKRGASALVVALTALFKMQKRGGLQPRFGSSLKPAQYASATR